MSQIGDQLWRSWLYVTQARSLAVILGVGFALLAVLLLLATRTRWGQAKPLTKCIALSVLAHVWLLMYALGTRAILPQGSLQAPLGEMSVSFDDSYSDFAFSEDGPLEGEVVANEAIEPWEQTLSWDELPKPLALESALARAELAPPELLTPPEPTPMPALPEMLPLQVSSPEAFTEPETADALAHTLEPVISPTTDEQQALVAIDPPALETATESPTELAAEAASILPPPAQVQAVAASDSPVLPAELQLPPDSQLPSEYRLRQAPNRLQLATAYGADADSEAAVTAGLKWLAQAQSRDGSWNAKQFGGGTETWALGESRHGTGAKADTGVSGLALLAFLSAGHTHMDGPYKETVQHGLEYLLRAQMPSGDLSGPKQVGSDLGVLNARMYCHSIATLALAEAHVMTGDAIVRDALLRSATYSIKAQDVRGGGWRYVPGAPGDLSQFGWQAMALKSVERSGIAIPAEVNRRMRRFLDSCAAGSAGGLCRYHPGEGRPSETMTAEGLACRLFLDYPSTLPAQREATEMIMRYRPGVGEDNVYFWYYATLALFQLQDENWRVWNQALKQRLLATQVPVYEPMAGSWHPDKLWGGYGGRVYSTAMSCLCLEVYYRYLPMYQRANLARSSDTSVR